MTTEKIVHGSCGKILPNTELKVVDLKTGANLPPGQQHQGEICIRGPQVRKLLGAMAMKTSSVSLD